jgi:hypothetical protein
MDDAEADALAYMGFPAQHRAKFHSTDPIERLNGEIKRRSDVVGIFPNEAAVTRLIGAILLEQNNEWAVQRTHYRRWKPSPHSALIYPSACPHWQPDRAGNPAQHAVCTPWHGIRSTRLPHARDKDGSRSVHPNSALDDDLSVHPDPTQRGVFRPEL